MAEEDDIRELIGRLANAKRQGTHVAPPAIAIIITALRLYLATRAVLNRPKGDPHDDAPRRKPISPPGPPTTIGNPRGHGLIAVTVTCAGAGCSNNATVPFSVLGLDDATPFPAIPALRGFRCRKCGSRRVWLMPDWTDAHDHSYRAH